MNKRTIGWIGVGIIAAAALYVLTGPGSMQPALKRETAHLRVEPGVSNYGPTASSLPDDCPRLDGSSGYDFVSNGFTDPHYGSHIKISSAEYSIATVDIEGEGADGKWYVVQEMVNPTKAGETLTFTGRWRCARRRAVVKGYAAGEVIVRFWDEGPKWADK